MTAPETLHEETLHENTLIVLTRHGEMRFAREYAYAAQCVKRVAELEARLKEPTYEAFLRQGTALQAANADLAALSEENATLRAAAEIVEAMERGEIRSMFYVADAPEHSRLAMEVFTKSGLDDFAGPTLSAAYAQATGRTE